MSDARSPLTPDQHVEQMRRARDVAQRKAASANREAERLRQEVRSLRHKNFTLQAFVDNPGSQSGYKRRYERLAEAVNMLRDILGPVLNGLDIEPPKTLEPPRPPAWARVSFQKEGQ